MFSGNIDVEMNNTTMNKRIPKLQFMIPEKYIVIRTLNVIMCIIT